MLRYALLFVLLGFSLVSQAMDTYRFGSRLVVVGDGAAKLLDVAGQPSFKEPIENTLSAHEGERWQYLQDGVSVTFTIKEGKVTAIEQVRN